MNTVPDSLPMPLHALIDALPVGVAVVDAQKRIVLMNPAFHESLELPPDGIPPGTRVEDAVRAAALRGIYGPGDPDAQVAAVLAPDRTRSGRLRRRLFKGRSFDLYNSPLPDGGYIVSAVETTSLIAERTAAERNAARTTGAIGSLSIGIAAFDPTGMLLFCNPSFIDVCGLPPQQVTPGLGFAALLDMMAARDEFAGADGMAFLAAQRDANRSVPHAARRLRSSGQVIDVVSHPLPDGGWTITTTDVSAQARAEDEAQRRARMLDSILEAVPHGICVYGPDHCVSFFNRTYTKVMAGASLRVGDHMRDVIRRRSDAGEYGPGNPDDVYRQQLAFDITRPQMRRRRRPDGTAIDVRTAPLPDGGHVSVVTDITALVEAEAELSRRAAEMEVMLAKIRHGILLWAPDKTLVAANAMAAELLGHPPGVLTSGRSEVELHEIMLRRGEWGGGEAAHAAAQQLQSRDRSQPFRRFNTMKSGRVLEIWSDPVPGGGWVTTFTDVTESRRAEEELRRAKEAAEAANQAKSRFLATMSHELRTPLNAVIGFSDTLVREAGHAGPDRVGEFARQINEAGRHLLDQINIILDVARIESGRFDLTVETVDVARLVRAVVRQAEPAAEAADITLRTDVPAALPHLQCDERRLRQALAQLTSNAVKFTPIGGVVTIGCQLEPDGGLTLFVRDTGIGIAGDDLEKVFEPFTQLDAAFSRRYHGAGLGLYIARALVNWHDGTLTLRSELGKGTSAEIRLPANRLCG